MFYQSEHNTLQEFPDPVDAEGTLLPGWRVATAADIERAMRHVPDQVSRYQARMALRNAEVFDAVELLMRDAATPVEYVEAWDNAQFFRRESPIVLAMAGALGWDGDFLDQLFIAAAQIEG